MGNRHTSNKLRKEFCWNMKISEILCGCFMTFHRFYSDRRRDIRHSISPLHFVSNVYLYRCNVQTKSIPFYCIYGREQVPASHQDNARVETRRPPQPQQWAQQTSALGRGGHSCFRGPQILMSIQYSQCSEQVPILGASSRCWNCLSSTNIFGHLFPNIFTVRQF